LLFSCITHIAICFSELSGRVSSHVPTSDALHFTYHFRHVTVSHGEDTVYVVVIRVVDELANHSRSLSYDSGNSRSDSYYLMFSVTSVVIIWKSSGVC